ncbi:MAG: hypothetical protein H6500_00695 [Candidatus Woesearchaeota archaeon]|nr:hypothetical protein [Nanoarchaeota archaeon]USN44350.1 MAG: hypothetical protein H6500_00695 [Candidatus Woesearchaeota archaeon]
MIEQMEKESWVVVDFSKYPNLIFPRGYGTLFLPSIVKFDPHWNYHAYEEELKRDPLFLSLALVRGVRSEDERAVFLEAVQNQNLREDFCDQDIFPLTKVSSRTGFLQTSSFPFYGALFREVFYRERELSLSDFVGACRERKLSSLLISFGGFQEELESICKKKNSYDYDFLTPFLKSRFLRSGKYLSSGFMYQGIRINDGDLFCFFDIRKTAKFLRVE